MKQKPYKLTGPQWHVLAGVAAGQPRPLMTPSTRRALETRDLIAGERGAYALTELGQRVYARLSVGAFCSRCGKPLTFERRTLVPNKSPAEWDCVPCGRA